MKSSTVKKLALLVFSFITVWYSFYLIQPPEPKPSTGALTSFSAERAFVHVKQIATRPHPLGSDSNDSVRSYILNELRGMGLQPEVLEGVGVSRGYRQGLAGYAKNILAKIDGSDPQKTILLMAHYDSVPTGPGAADDGSSVAAILEAIRAIRSQDQPLKNNVWILFTDGEERGLLGAESFADEFKQLNQIDLVLNFEARGSAGPSMMFETSSPNGGLIPHFAEATPDPVANSLMYTVYKMLPNDTDMSVTKRAGLPGLNFAFTKRFLNYHTMQDNPRNLSLASLQHQGENLLSNVRHFGNTDFDLSSKSEFVYFNNATGGITYYPSSWSFPLAVITAILFLAFLVFLFRTNQISLGRYLGSLGLFLVITLVGTVLTYFLWKGFEWLHPEYRWLLMGENYSHSWYLWGFLLLNLGISCGIYGWIQIKLSTQQLLSGSFTVWVLLSLGSAWYLPTASYLFTWPALMALIGWIILGSEISKSSRKSVFILAISLSGALFIIPPYIYLIQIMLTTRMIAVSVLLFLLTTGLCWALVWVLIQGRKLMWSSGFLVGAVACFIVASVNSGFDTNHKKENDINYVQDLDSQRAYWVSRDFKPDSWTGQYLSTDFKQDTLQGIKFFGRRSVLYHSAQAVHMPTPAFKVLADSSSDSLRFLKLQIDPKQKGIGVQISWGNLPVAEFGIHGKKIYSRTRTVENHSRPVRSISYFQDLSEPINLSMAFSKNKNPVFYFDFVRQGLPTHLIPGYKNRSPDMMPAPYAVTNATIWQSKIGLDTLKIGN